MSVQLSTIKSALKIDYADDDTDLIRLREAAVQFVEKTIGASLTPRATTLYLSRWTNSLIPEHPFNSLTNVKYYDSSNVLTTMPEGDYWIDQTDGPMPRIRFLEAPAIYEGTAISVNYNAGYSATPDPLVHAVIGLVGAWYNNPEAFQPIGLTAVPMGVAAILEIYSNRSNLR